MTNIDLGSETSPLRVAADVPTRTSVNAPGEVEALDVVLWLGQWMDEHNLSELKRMIVVPRWFYDLLGTTLKIPDLGAIDRFIVRTSDSIKDNCVLALRVESGIVITAYVTPAG